MDILNIVNTQFAIPAVVALVLVLVYVFGFKRAAEPAFDQLSYTGDDRKPAGKKRRLKDKKSQSNGHATAVSENSAEVKVGTNKSGGKVEKSPSKEAANRSAKQQKKQEPSPLKDKPITKQKDNRNEAESTPKQLKEKKQDGAEKSPVKDNKSTVAKKGKGKENHVEEIKNKKNEKNLAKLKKAEGKPPGFDDDGWKEVLSTKDKKSRKKDEIEEIIPIKNVAKAEGTPKKKKSKNIELVLVDLSAPLENKDREDEKEAEKEVESEVIKVTEIAQKIEMKKPEEKKPEIQIEKKKKVEQEAQGEKEVDEEEKLVESTPKSKKKNKKKAEGKKEDIEEPAMKKLSESSDKKPAETVVVEVKVKPAEPREVAATDSEPAAAFDELGDTWKEAKVPKKSKKKVRKDQ